jgi:serine/threonine protein kinase
VSLSDAAVDRLLRVAGQVDASAGRYAVEEEIGRGGMGVVYRAHDRLLGRDVALKVLRADGDALDLAERLRREARVLAALEHPGMAPVHDVGTLGGRPFYVMKLVRGRRLDEWAAGAPPLPERLRVFDRVCEAAAYAHAHGVVHRDLKPSNVMLGEFGEVLVMDWGVAKVLAEPGEAGSVSAPAGGGTRAGTLLGTPGYMAPEQARGGAVDARSDVHALGAILHFLLAGAPPAEAVLPKGTPPPLAAIVRRATAEDPRDRYASALELAADVRAFASREPVAAYPEGVFGRTRRLASRYRVPIALVLAYMVMRVALILFL